MAWSFPCVAKATQGPTVSRSPTAINTNWHPYPRSMQIRSGCIPYMHSGNLLSILLITIDLDILYVHSLFASQLESYPRIGLSFWFPYGKDKTNTLPNIWAMVGYIELYQSHPERSTWGNRIGLGIFRRGRSSDLPDSKSSVYKTPEYSFLGTKEIIYHWLFTPSWQLNFGIGLFFNSWPQNIAYQTSDEDHVVIRPIVSMGIRYISHKEPFLRPGYKSIHFRKTKKNRIDCSIAYSSRYLKSAQSVYSIFRGSSLLAFTLNKHNALLCSMELGYSQYKKAYMQNKLPLAGIEPNILLGYEIRYGRYLLQLQGGYICTDVANPRVRHSYERTKLDSFKRQSFFCVNLQYMPTEYFFIGITIRSKETIPGIRLGISL